MWADEQQRLVVVLLVAAVLALALLPGKRQPDGKLSREPEPRKYRGTSWIERLLAWLVPPPDPCPFGHIVASFRWLPHLICFGAPGSGKSTFLMRRILDWPVGLWGLIVAFCWLFSRGMWPRLGKRRGKLVVTGNFSAPFRAAVLWLIEHGYPACIWTPDPQPGEGFGLDVLEGPPDNVAERIIAMHPVGTGNTGLRSGSVEGMLVDTIYTIDRQQQARTFAAILATIWTVGIRDLDESGNPTGEPRPLTQQETRGLEDWSTRLRTLRRRLGASVGTDLQLSEALAQGHAVLVECSSYRNPNSTEQLINLFVYVSMWLVGAVGNFDLIIDEPGAVGPGTFTRLLTATRARDVRIMIGMQSRKQVDDSLREMTHTALLLGAAGSAPEAREFMSKIVGGDVPPEDFILLEPPRWYERILFWQSRRGLKSCEGYLFCNGRLDFVRTPFVDLRILKRWPAGSIPKLPAGLADEPEAPAHPALSVAGTPDTGSGTVQSGTDEAGRRDARPSWVKDDRPDTVRFFGSMKRESCGCLVWTKGDNGAGRPKGSLVVVGPDGKRKKTSPTVYVQVYEWVHGPGSAKPSVDHRCHTFDETCPGNDLCENRECVSPMHPYQEPCRHGLCCEDGHLEAVSMGENQQRNADQKRRYEQWRATFRARLRGVAA